MGTRSLLHPVGPLPPRVYWMRRLAPLTGLALLMAVVAISCSGGSSGTSKRPAAAPPTPTPAPTTSPSSAAVAKCKRSELAVTASTDADTYAPGTLPRLRVAIRNTGSSPCVLTESPSTRGWTISSGADQIWTTEGCAASHVASNATLSPGESAKHSVVWSRHRSDPNCATSTTSASPGTYQLTVTVNGIRSAPAVFHLTG